MNSIMVIHPFKDRGLWVFNDSSKGLIKEPFVSGIGEMIDVLTSGIDDPESGFSLLFSAGEFPGYQVKLDWVREEMGGNWYSCAEYQMVGWLCPALFKYFDAAPAAIYVKTQGGCVK